MLFMQLAVASYVCPGEGRLHMQAAAGMMPAEQAMEDCEGMDMEQPGLCHAYDQKASQSLDKPGTPAVSPFAPVFLVATLLPLDMAALPPPAHAEALMLARATAPPLSIRHCCFQI